MGDGYKPRYAVVAKTRVEDEESGMSIFNIHTDIRTVYRNNPKIEDWQK